MRLIIGVLWTLVACSTHEDKLAAKLALAADMFDSQMERLEPATQSGKPCYPIVDGFIHYKIQDFGHVVAKDVRELEDRFNFVVVVFDAYNTTLKDRFNSLAGRIETWKRGPYAKAIEACERCAESAPGLGESCSVP